MAAGVRALAARVPRRPAVTRLATDASGPRRPAGRRDGLRRAAPGRRARRHPPARRRLELAAGRGATAACWPSTSPPARRCRRSTTRPWTATRCGPPTWPAPPPTAPVTLPVRGEIAAGDTGDYRLEPGTLHQDHDRRAAARGRRRGGPGGVDRRRHRDRVAFRRPAEPGHAVRRRGDDVAGRPCCCPRAPWSARCSWRCSPRPARARCWPARRPRVAVISTGNELVEPGTPLIPGQIWESNSFMLAAAARRAGAPSGGIRLRDDPAVVLGTPWRGLLGDADLLVTSGGVSMGGEHDVVKAALSKLGTVTFRKVAMQPGMPQGFGTLGPDRTPIFTLPGNPVSAYVSFSLFVQPALGCPARSFSATMPAASRRPSPRRPFPAGPAVVSCAGVLDDAPGDGRAADRAVLPPAGRAGPGQRADHRAGGRHPAGARATAVDVWACHDATGRRCSPSGPVPGTPGWSTCPART